jgi:TfoX/Sxy family transcriptional regulator of competence genes
MVCDEGLVQRIRDRLQDERDIEDRRMFGGVAFLVNGNMSCGVHQDDLIVRLEPEGHAGALLEPYTRTFDITGKPMRGWVTVAADGCADDADLARWIDRAVAFARTLPVKVAKAPKPAKTKSARTPTKRKTSAKGSTKKK